MLEKRSFQLKKKIALKFQPPINGKEQNYFGLGPSKKIGLIKDAIKEAILDGVISNEFEAAFEK